MKKIMFLMVLFCFQAITSFAQDFVKRNIDFPKLGHGTVAWADYDQDGNLDFIITGREEGGLYHADIFKNEGNDRFRNINAGIKGGIDGSVAWGDYNGDGLLDLLISGKYYDKQGFPVSYTKLYRNEGNDTFSEVNFEFYGVSGIKSGARFADFDHDGRLDILLVKRSTIMVYMNDGNYHFTDVKANLENVTGYCKFFDYDNDGDLDVIITGMEPFDWLGKQELIECTKIYKNDGDDHFTDIGFQLTGLSNGSVDCGDYNNDGKVDLLLTGEDYILVPFGNLSLQFVGWNHTWLYTYEGNDEFVQTPNKLQGVSYGEAKFGDYDHDGDLDILMTGNQNTSVISYYTLVDPNTILYKNLLINTTSDNGNKIEIYPNPAKDFIFIKTTNLTTTGSLIQISNLQGQVVYSKQMALRNNYENKIYLPHISGIYLVEVINPNLHFSKKLWINKDHKQ